MTSMLLFLSLLLHIITLTVIFQLFKQVQLLKQNNSGEMADLMETYLEDIKEENRLLENALFHRSASFESSARERTDNSSETAIKNEDDYIPKTHVTDKNELSLEAQILQLHDKGMTVMHLLVNYCGKTKRN
ncbi:hypothetical protein [Lentibacillus sp. CBA3610]|uniref:hypothetical protein n=1 Tax=Lentibacillus sp. CBA3610 TaxID=2518176 RepID=UPI0015962675|nr:hypothetical protein [Lentibacillus sp. CBA3610]QKY69053.1 hypothetical protein Len3610_05005 [Lentibacillus sp. CBA3610]